MSHTSNTIKAPVVMPNDIAAVLQIAGTNLEQICKSSAINKWAKYKPVSKNVLGVLTDAHRQSVNYGISRIPTWTNLSFMIDFWLLNDRTNQKAPACGNYSDYWYYNQPTGGSSSPYRLSDFAKDSSLGYFHGADAPLKGLTSLNLMITANGQLNMVWETGAQDPQTLKYTDLTYDGGGQISLSGFYFTAILARVGATGTKYIMTDVDQSAESAITQGVYCRPWFQDLAHVNDFLGYADSAQFYCMICLANQQIYDTFNAGSSTYRKFVTNLSGISANNFVALLDGRQTVTITKVVAKFVITEMIAWKNLTQSNRFIYYTLTVRNNDPYTDRWYIILVEVKDSNGNVIGSKQYDTASDYVVAGDTKTITDYINAGQYYSGATQVTVTTRINPNRDHALITATDTITVNISSAPPQNTPTPY